MSWETGDGRVYDPAVDKINVDSTTIYLLHADFSYCAFAENIYIVYIEIHTCIIHIMQEFSQWLVLGLSPFFSQTLACIMKLFLRPRLLGFK